MLRSTKPGMLRSEFCLRSTPKEREQEQVDTSGATEGSSDIAAKPQWLRHIQDAATNQKRNAATTRLRRYLRVTQPLLGWRRNISADPTKHLGIRRRRIPSVYRPPPEPLHEPSTVTRPRHGPTKVVLRCVKFVWLRHRENAATRNGECRNRQPNLPQPRS